MTPHDFAVILNDELATSPTFNELVKGCMVKDIDNRLSAIPIILSDGTKIGIKVELVE